MYGYIDESGEPGKAKNDNDYLVLSLVLFSDLEHSIKCEDTIDRFRKRNNLIEEELHHSKNSKVVRKKFLQMIPNLEFKYITVAIKKDTRKTTTYSEIVEILVDQIVKLDISRIYLDRNPNLYKQLKIKGKTAGLRIKYREVESCKNNLIQLADYVVSTSTKIIKNTARSKEYRKFKYKCIGFIIK